MKIGPVTLTRDSALLWLPVIVSACTFLGTMPPPWRWTYTQWIQTASAAAAGLSLKLQSSRLPSAAEVARGIRDNGQPIALLLALGLAAGGLSSCASLGSPRHRAAISVVSADAILSAIQDSEMALVCGRSTAPAPPRCVPHERHQEISAKLVTAFQYDRRIAELVRALPAGESSPDVATLVGQIRALVDAVLALIPESAQRRTLVASIGGV
jgi:hypothetical protein